MYYNPPLTSLANTVYEDESAYQFIQVTKYTDDKTYLQYNEGLGIQSVYDKENPYTGLYYDYAQLLPYMTDRKKDDYLIIGFAGGTIGRALKFTHGDNVNVVGVEIDNKVIDIAEKYFGLDKTSIDTISMDGRMFLEFNDKKFSNIYIDAYNNELYIPWTFTSKEFWELTKKRLTDDGVMAINVNATNPSSKILKLISNTISKIYEYTYLMGPVRTGSNNYMIIGANHEIDFNKMITKNSKNQLMNNINYFIDNYRKIDYDISQKIITDDWSPIEHLTDKMIFEFVKRKF